MIDQIDKVNTWLASVIEGYCLDLEDNDDEVCPLCIADKLTNDFSTGMLSDAYKAAKEDPEAAMEQLNYQRLMFLGMAQIANDCMVAVMEMHNLDKEYETHK